MSTSSKQNDSEDEFESADEGESIAAVPIVKSITPPPSHSILPSVNEKQVELTSPPPPPITAGWGDWKIDDEPSKENPIKISTPTLLQQDSISSLSSSSPSKAGSLSQTGSEEDDQIESSEQQRLQKKKFRKKQLESTLLKEESKTNTRVSRPIERRDEESSSAIVTKHNVQDAHHVLDRLSAQSPTRTSTWHSPWSNFGSLLSTAKQSVSTLTNTVSEGFSAVIESVEAGLGAPDPHQLAEMDRMAFKIKGETSDSEDEPEPSTVQTEKNDSVTNQDGWFNALSLEKLTNTGMKVVSGSLDVLENVGKKTFDIINEADPDFKGTRRLLSKQNRPTLSDIIREAQHEKETKSTVTKNETVTFFQLFEKHLGLAHFEALELLSNQSLTILQPMSHGNEKLLEQISTYFHINDNDDDELTLNALTITDDKENDIPTLDILSQKFTAYQTQLRSTIPVDKLLEVYESANQFLKEWEWMDTELDQQTLSDEAIDSLAILCASIIEYYRKTAELFLIGCKSLTSFSIDIELLAIYQKQQQDFSNMLAGIPNLFAKHMKQISNIPTNNNDRTDNLRCDPKLKQKLLNQMFIQSSSSQTYASDAYALLKPIVSQSILYHTSTTR